MIAGHSHREVTASHRLQCLKQFLRGIRLSIGVRFDFGTATGGWRSRAEITHGIPLKGKGTLHRASASRFSTDKIARTVPNQAKYLRYYSLLDQWIGREKINSVVEQLFPRRIK
jgi:hypothetical protein